MLILCPFNRPNFTTIDFVNQTLKVFGICMNKTWHIVAVLLGTFSWTVPISTKTLGILWNPGALAMAEPDRIRVPEQPSGLPYDLFKLDVYYLGRFCRVSVHMPLTALEDNLSMQEFNGLEVLGDLARLMTKPTANETRLIWNSLRSLPSIPPRWTRLRPTREEGSIERIMNDALDVVGMVRGSMGL